MIIFAKKRFAFEYQGQTFVIPRIGDFVEAPDWVRQSELYRMALVTGEVREMKHEVAVPVQAPTKKASKGKGKHSAPDEPEDEAKEEGDGEAEQQ